MRKNAAGLLAIGCGRGRHEGKENVNLRVLNTTLFYWSVSS
jgi:hypothetical protein